MKFVLDGESHELDPVVALSRLRSGLPDLVARHWVEVEGVRWPAKQALEVATGIERSSFTSHMAIRTFRRLGLATSHLPSNGEAVTGKAAMPWSPSSEAVDIIETERAFSTLLTYLTSESLTDRIASLEGSLLNTDAATIGAVVANSGMSDELVAAAMLVRLHAGRLNDVIHAAVITLTLPRILEPGEQVTVRPSLAAGNDPGRLYDLETSRRIAEFKVSLWKGADAMRKRGTFANLVQLALDESGKKAQLFVAGPEPIKFLTQSCSKASWGLNRSSPNLRARFEERFGDLAIPIKDFTAGPAGHVELVNLTNTVPAIAAIMDQHS